MPTHRVSAIDHSIEMTHIWLNDLMAELGSEDRRYGYRVMKAVLHAVRDGLPVDEAAHLAAQLPELIRGIYYEGWDPSRTPARYRDSKPFLDRIAAEASLAGDSEASYAAEAVLAVVRKHISAGEFEQVMHMLRAPVQAVVRPGDARPRPAPDWAETLIA
ncbi:MAG TPA: DUF2267 domain-containing protein [Solirubrobacteraceae bacterium]|nr:DUF2267 domain-containing protein [Solirubrobacteraceae bacterium]